MAISPYEIGRNASEIYSLKEDARKESKHIIDDINQSNSYWEGTASNAFKKESQTFEQDFIRLIRSLDHLQGGVDRLKNEVQRADNEREAKRRAAEAASLAAKKPKK